MRACFCWQGMTKSPLALLTPPQRKEESFGLSSWILANSTGRSAIVYQSAYQLALALAHAFYRDEAVTHGHLHRIETDYLADSIGEYWLSSRSG